MVAHVYSSLLIYSLNQKTAKLLLFKKLFLPFKHIYILKSAIIAENGFPRGPNKFHQKFIVSYKYGPLEFNL